ncbi:Na(+)/H(+) exchange regulatory cofactor NHE-RF1-like isoform X2 [Polyodon spathula]|uniref:Na(+)/H(+) exchange regulatory cofactor NHE-RF1-like isoform X2 n=1 Tax=Polyodon spathula TaxID=7913 RepID=UPI001B7E5379|nr:Na(+)/H(+) exchange regulatory cofactor NHE-RF1-like isoform X2 [Polyodon spathula]
MSRNSECLRPRLCSLEKGANGYGFHLHGEKGKIGQFIRLVEPDSAAEKSGLRAGDRLAFVNGVNVENESHQQVVSRIKAQTMGLKLVVVDRETDDLLKKLKLLCLEEFVTSGIPNPSEPGESRLQEEVMSEESAPTKERNGEAVTGKSIGSVKFKSEHRPRLCNIKKGSTGYGFNLHSEKAKPGQYIRAVEPNSPAERANLRAQDRIVEVNGMSVKGKQHSEVVAAIKAGGQETSLLVVDPETEDFFKRCRVTPTEAHLTGPLPEPVLNGDVEEKANGKVAEEADYEVSVSQSPSNTSSNTSTGTPTNEEKPVESDLKGLASGLSLQEAKERAHRKRSSKQAPAMDWSKKNELFSNL